MRFSKKKSVISEISEKRVANEIWREETAGPSTALRSGRDDKV
jgi:hypothetical protein